LRVLFRRRSRSLRRRRLWLSWRHVTALLTAVGAASLFALTATAAAPPARLTATVTSQHTTARTGICGRTRRAAVVRAGTNVRIAGRVTVTQPPTVWFPLHTAFYRCGPRKTLVSTPSFGVSGAGTFSKAVAVRARGDYELVLEFNGTNGERARALIWIRAR